MTNPHPATLLKGFTKTVTLSTGVEVIIKKLNIEAYTMDAARHVMSTPALMTAAGEYARESAAAIESVDGPSPAMSREQMLETSLQIQEKLLRGALIEPKLEALIELYGGSLEEPDYGLGPDLTMLLEAVNDFSSPKPEVVAQAEAFPGKVRGKSPRAG
ncbi:hypothetical protein DKM44_02325 [Deinococcus irradiatisoli]|uniref:Uncharacterized protein n=1 Tax=Deinococcus irradiatisoli TaxID=2202254 RepID=A0A2Z3JLT7_9DEIO|nr:hypothetical protein [Deinococcus irradiatisoli]AWN22214.1 hypothetical protein DKM44_02325 [Deinococcus irradiatisoli]